MSLIPVPALEINPGLAARPKIPAEPNPYNPAELLVA
jgi:hypothetical protein